MRTTITRALIATGLAAGLAAVVPAADAAGVPECTTGQLAASYRGGDAGMSHVYGRIILTNTSGRACSVQGYGGLSYVGGGDGTQVGAAADRDSAGPSTRVVLQPGQKARSKVSETSTGPYSTAQCRPTPVDGFRIYVPDSTTSIFLAHATTGCADATVHLLSHQAYRRA